VRILLVAATAAEINPVTAGLRREGDRGPKTTRYVGGGHDIDVLVSGVGMVATATWCAHALCRDRYDVALNLGVCGSFDRSLTPGSVAHVVSDRLAELGAEDDETFLSIHEMHLLDENEPPVRQRRCS
jgi:futalosine hydrolase